MSAIPTHLPTASLIVDNMHCPSCVEAITNLLSHMSSIRNLTVSLLLHRVTFAVDTATAASKQVTTLDREVEKAARILTAEGGFLVSREDGHDTTPDGGRLTLADRLFGKRRATKEDKLAEQRHQRHLERCEACREEHEAKVRGLAPPTLPTAPSPDQVTVTTVSIDGMTCASCTDSISRALKENPSILDIEINLLTSSGTIRHKSILPVPELVEMIDDVGFETEAIESHPEAPEVEPTADAERLVRTTLSIEGMTCASCSSAIDRALRGNNDVVETSIDVLGNKGVITHKASLSAEMIKDMIEDVGYDAAVVASVNIDEPKRDHPGSRTITIRVQGVFCNNCIKQINEHLKSLPLLSFTPVSLQSPVSTITYKPREPLTIRDILHSLSSLAPEFDAEVVRQQSLSERSRIIQRREMKLLGSHLVVAVLLAIPSFIIMIVGMVLLPAHHPFRMYWHDSVWGGANRGTVAMWPLATISQFGVGWLFYKRTFNSLWPHLRALVPRRLLSSRAPPPRKLSLRSLFSFGSMDLLVTLSTSVSYFASVAMMALDVRAGPHAMSVGSYFDSSVFLLMFILLGRTLEAYAKSRTTDAVALLGNLRPATALLVEEGEDLDKAYSNGATSDSASADKEEHKDEPTGASQREVPIDHVEYGDILLVTPGSLPPTDGTIVSGTTKFDESSLTGESLPVSKGPGDEVFTGTTNKQSAITIRVTSLAQDTMLERIIKAVSDASGRKAPLEKAAERLTGVFVPIVVYLAICILALWLGLVYGGAIDPKHYHGKGGRAFFALEFAISVLVVACPCGIGLAVPCANAVGNGLAAAAGILASGGGEAFTAATAVRAIAFDKTGTLTQGKSAVTDEVEGTVPPSIERAAVLAGIRAVEAQSTHPLAVGLVEHLAPGEAEVVDSAEIAGRGLRASVSTPSGPLELLIGNEALLSDNGVSVPAAAQTEIERWTEDAKSLILVAARRPTGSFAFAAGYALADPLREETKGVLATLRARGYRVLMLSGDNARTARAVGRQLDMAPEDVHAGVGPEGKAAAIAALQAQTTTTRRLFRRRQMPLKVMFVGDGLNDAVALAAADTSAAMGHGSQATLASADFVLLRSDLGALLTLLRLSNKVRNRQWFNLFWAMIFNTTFLPIAAGVLFAVGFRLNPVWSAVLMAGSSVSVVISSLALRWGL